MGCSGGCGAPPSTPHPPCTREAKTARLVYKYLLSSHQRNAIDDNLEIYNMELKTTGIGSR